MCKLIYSMNVSLDGFIAGPGGELDWSVPDEELHRFHGELTRELGVHLCGRALYETMLYWETAERDQSSTDYEVEFARIWKNLPKIVFSKTLDSVEGNASLAKDGVAQEVARLKQQQHKNLGVGGAGLAAELATLDLIDEYLLFVNPVVLGAGTPFLPRLQQRINLELVHTRTFGSRVVHLRYRRV